MMIDNWRWAGVPFYLRTGKRLNTRSTEIAIRFKRAPYALFRETPVEELDADWLILRVQPDEGIRLRFNAKRPGPAMALESVAMEFKYKDWFKQAPAVGYETLIYDCLIGDATLFQRADQVEAAWGVVEPVLQGLGESHAAAFPQLCRGQRRAHRRQRSSGPGRPLLAGDKMRKAMNIAGDMEVVATPRSAGGARGDLIAERMAGCARAVPPGVVGRLDAARRPIELLAQTNDLRLGLHRNVLRR